MDSVHCGLALLYLLDDDYLGFLKKNCRIGHWSHEVV